MNQAKITEIEALRAKIRDAQKIVIGNLWGGDNFGYDQDITINNARSIVEDSDKLNAVITYLDKIESVLTEIDGKWCGGELFCDFGKINPQGNYREIGKPSEEALALHTKEMNDVMNLLGVGEKNTADHAGGTVDAVKSKQSDNDRPVMKIEITKGMIRQNLLSFTRPIKKRQLKRDQRIVLESKSERIESEIVSPGNRLRERGAVGRLYSELHARPGDFLVLTPAGAKEENRWQVSLQTAATNLIKDLPL